MKDHSIFFGLYSSNFHGFSVIVPQQFWPSQFHREHSCMANSQRFQWLESSLHRPAARRPSNSWNSEIQAESLVHLAWDQKFWSRTPPPNLRSRVTWPNKWVLHLFTLFDDTFTGFDHFELLGRAGSQAHNSRSLIQRPHGIRRRRHPASRSFATERWFVGESPTHSLLHRNHLLFMMNAIRDTASDQATILSSPCDPPGDPPDGGDCRVQTHMLLVRHIIRHTERRSNCRRLHQISPNMHQFFTLKYW